jgi:hypothetical protein
MTATAVALKTRARLGCPASLPKPREEAAQRESPVHDSQIDEADVHHEESRPDPRMQRGEDEHHERNVQKIGRRDHGLFARKGNRADREGDHGGAENERNERARARQRHGDLLQCAPGMVPLAGTAEGIDGHGMDDVEYLIEERRVKRGPRQARIHRSASGPPRRQGQDGAERRVAGARARARRDRTMPWPRKKNSADKWV